jgi:hypothetical protein
MVWFFEKGEQRLTWEVRRRASAYEIAVQHNDAAREVRAFDTPTELLAQLDRIPQRLLRDGWRACDQDMVMLRAAPMPAGILS